MPYKQASRLGYLQRQLPLVSQRAFAESEGTLAIQVPHLPVYWAARLWGKQGMVLWPGAHFPRTELFSFESHPRCHETRLGVPCHSFHCRGMVGSILVGERRISKPLPGARLFLHFGFPSFSLRAKGKSARAEVQPYGCICSPDFDFLVMREVLCSFVSDTCHKWKLNVPLGGVNHQH